MTSAPETLPPPTLTDPDRHPAASPPPAAAPTTASSRTTAVLVGLLFVTATAAFITADTLNADVLSRPDFLTGAAADTPALAPGALLVLGQFGVVGIAVLLFPLLKRHGESLPSPMSVSGSPNWPRACSTWRSRCWRSNSERDCATAPSTPPLRRVWARCCTPSTASPS